MDVISDPQQGGDPTVVSQPAAVDAAALPTMDLERTLPRQISTGRQRGTQDITGSVTVAEPVNGTPVITISGTNQNQIFHNPATDTDVITIGKYSDGTFNFRIQDTDEIGIAQFGNFANGSTALKIAFPGVEVATATDNQLIFTSDRNLFKIIGSGTASETLPAGSYTIGQLFQIVIPHGQKPRVPAFLLYVNNPVLTSVGNGLQPTPASTYAKFNALPGGLPIYLPTILSYGTIDDTNLYINIQFLTAYTFVGGDTTWTYKYYILQETASAT